MRFWWQRFLPRPGTATPTTVIVALLLFFPVGLFFMWRDRVWALSIRLLITAVFVVYVANLVREIATT
jgi:hypothetical protein